MPHRAETGDRAVPGLHLDRGTAFAWIRSSLNQHTQVQVATSRRRDLTTARCCREGAGDCGTALTLDSSMVLSAGRCRSCRPTMRVEGLAPSSFEAVGVGDADVLPGVVVADQPVEDDEGDVDDARPHVEQSVKSATQIALRDRDAEPSRRLPGSLVPECPESLRSGVTARVSCGATERCGTYWPARGTGQARHTADQLHSSLMASTVYIRGSRSGRLGST